MLTAQEAQKKAEFEGFAQSKTAFLDGLAPGIERVNTSIQEALAFETEARAFWKDMESFGENREALLKLLANDPGINPARQKLLTSELRFALNLMAKTQEIADFEERWGKAFEAFDVEEIERLNRVRMEKDYQVTNELTKQLMDLREAVAANPNYVTEKQAELKKAAKGGKAKK